MPPWSAYCSPPSTLPYGPAPLRPRRFRHQLIAFLLLVMWRVPPWLVVILGAVAASVAAAQPNGMGTYDRDVAKPPPDSGLVLDDPRAPSHRPRGIFPGKVFRSSSFQRFSGLGGSPGLGFRIRT